MKLSEQYLEKLTLRSGPIHPDDVEVYGEIKHLECVMYIGKHLGHQYRIAKAKLENIAIEHGLKFEE